MSITPVAARASSVYDKCVDYDNFELSRLNPDVLHSRWAF